MSMTTTHTAPALFSLVTLAVLSTLCLSTGAAPLNALQNVQSDTSWLSWEGLEYAYFKTLLTWDEAEIVCTYHNGHLASVHDRDLGQHLFTLAGRNAKTPHHLGGRSVGGVWHWTDGSTFDYTNWLVGEPNNQNGNEECLAVGQPDFGTGAQWNDRRCGRNQASPFMCQRSPLVNCA